MRPRMGPPRYGQRGFLSVLVGEVKALAHFIQ